ncbi:MAG: hypothetical protein GY751_08195 [Bacteroidetes bacterium]|nr:hypothetical protein [Bacteroidota bacterium]
MGITTTYEKPYMEAGVIQPGLWVYDKQQTMDKVEDQVKQILSTIQDAEGVAADKTFEWISADLPLNMKPTEVDFPKGEPFACMRYGSNEGYLVVIYVVDRNKGTTTSAFVIKYLSDESFVYDIAKNLNKAFYDGMYERVLMPGCHIAA